MSGPVQGGASRSPDARRRSSPTIRRPRLGLNSRGTMASVTRISDEDLAKAMAENVDAEGNDVGLEAWVASWTPEQRTQSVQNLRRWVADARHAIGGDTGDPSDA